MPTSVAVFAIQLSLTVNALAVQLVVDGCCNRNCFLCSYIIFSILPTIADILIAIIFFLTVFNAWFALIIFVTMVLYLGEFNNDNFVIGLTHFFTN